MDLTGRVSSSLRCQSSSWVSRALHLSDSLVTSRLIDLCWSGSDPEVLSVSRDTAIQHDDDDDVSDETDDATYCRCPRYRKELVHWPATVDHSIICSQSRVSSQTTLDAGLWCRPVINHSIENPSSDCSHLLLPDDRLVSTHWTHPQQLCLLTTDPVIQISQTDQQRAPVLPCVLQPRPGNTRDILIVWNCVDLISAS